MNRSSHALVLALALGGCASYQPVPDGHTGPVAVVSDSGERESGGRARLFSLTAIDGNRISSSFAETARASEGKGLSLLVRIVSRQIPAKAMKVTLRGAHMTGAPIHAIFSRAAGTFLSVEGVVDFAPVPDGEYVVKGELDPSGSAIWIEDARTGQLVTQRIQDK